MPPPSRCSIPDGSSYSITRSCLINQIVALERRVRTGGRDLIDHPPNAHDDLANAALGLAATLTAKHSAYDPTFSWVFEDRDVPLGARPDPHGIDAFRRSRLRDYYAAYGGFGR